MQSAFLRVARRVMAAALLTLCQCSLVNLDSLVRGAPDTGAGDAAPPQGPNDSGPDDAAGSDVCLDPESDFGLPDAPTELPFADGACDGFGFDAVVPDVSAPDASVPDAGPDVATDGAISDASPDVAVDGGMKADAGDAVVAFPGNDADVDGGALVALYLFDETSGTSSADSSGNGQTATMQGATFSPGLLNSAATMNGSAQYVSLPTGIVSSLTAFSICTWVNLNTALQHTHIFDFGTGTTAYMFLTPHSGSGPMQFAITTSSVAGEQILTGSAQLATGSWQHVCVTLEGTTGTLYLNGTVVTQNPSMTLTPASLGATTQNWLGRTQFAADPYLNGKIDSFRIYARALAPAEIKQLVQQRL